ncbi:hypothetical protein ACRPFF_11040, partial [Neisseria sp. SLRRB23]
MTALTLYRCAADVQAALDYYFVVDGCRLFLQHVNLPVELVVGFHQPVEERRLLLQFGGTGFD